MAGEVKWTTAKLEWKGGKMGANVKKAARTGTRKAAERLKALAIPKTPIRDGVLRESASVKGVNAEPIALVVFDTPYAAAQHEHEEYHHDEGQAHYLSEPLQENGRQLQGIIANEIREALRDA